MKYTLVSRKMGNVKRFGAREEMLVGDKKLYCKYVHKGYNDICEVINSKGAVICVDISETEEYIEEVIYDRKGNFTIVIIEYQGYKFKGKSKCHFYDSFSPNDGYNIAKARAVIKKNEYILSKYK